MKWFKHSSVFEMCIHVRMFTHVLEEFPLVALCKLDYYTFDI